MSLHSPSPIGGVESHTRLLSIEGNAALLVLASNVQERKGIIFRDPPLRDDAEAHSSLRTPLPEKHYIEVVGLPR
jgi:hypothetical protein